MLFLLLFVSLLCVAVTVVVVVGVYVVVFVVGFAVALVSLFPALVVVYQDNGCVPKIGFWQTKHIAKGISKGIPEY